MFGQANIFVLGDTDPAYKVGLHEQRGNDKHAFSIHLFSVEKALQGRV